MFHALLMPEPAAHGSGSLKWILMALIVVSGLAAIISMLRFGVRTFWASGDIAPPRLQAAEVVPICMLILACVVMTVQAGPIFDYVRRTSDGIHQPAHYMQRVLDEPVVPNPSRENAK
jgi:multicomponent K+:H+ antiporter subunit D